MKLLISVTSLEECKLVLSSGVSMIDLKDTSHGALAALDIQLTEQIMVAIKHYRTEHPAQSLVVSATVGDDCNTAEDLKLLMDERFALNIDVIKLPATVWNHHKFSHLIQEYLLRGVNLIAIFAPEQLTKVDNINVEMERLASNRFMGVMVDTTDKSISLNKLLDHSEVKNFVSRSRHWGLTVGLAGGLRIEDYDLLSEVAPDFMGFRSGVCQSFSREKSLCPVKLNMLLTKTV